MLSSESEELETFVRLQSDRSPATFQARYAKCETIIARHFEDGSEFLFALIRAAVEAGLQHSNLIDDAVSFLDETHLARLAFFLQGEAKRGTDVNDLLSQTMLQAPGLFPDSMLAANYDFADWQQHADPRSPPMCQHFIFEGGSPSDSPFPAHHSHPTWHLPTVGEPLTVGGAGSATCPTCQQKLTHLVTLEGHDPTISVPRLCIETCTNSLEPTYYFHDAAGAPAPIAPFHSAYDFTSDPATRESTVRLAPTPQRWLRQSYG